MDSMDWMTNRKTYRLAFLGLATLVSCYLLYMVRGILIPFLLAAFLAYLLQPLVSRLERRGIPHLLAIILTYVCVLGTISALGVFTLPKLLEQLNELLTAIPRYTQRTQEFMNYLEGTSARYPPGVQHIIDDKLNGWSIYLTKAVNQAVDGLLKLIGYLPTLALVPFLSFYMLKDAEVIKRLFESILPASCRIDMMGLVRDMDDVLKCFIRCNVLVCFIVGILCWVGYTLVGLPFALILGVVAGVTDAIPFFGPLIGLVPALAIALLNSWRMVLWTVLVAFIVQQLEANIISPKILGDGMGLHPIMVVFVLLAGGHLFGIWGMLLAVPVAAVLKVLIRFIFLKLVATGD